MASTSIPTTPRPGSPRTWKGLPNHTASPGRFTALVVGGGLTGVEAATELAARLRAVAAGRGAVSSLPTGRRASVPTWATAPAASSRRRCARWGSRHGRESTIASIDENGARLASGDYIAAATIVWCGGMRAQPLAASLPGPHDRFGRVEVDRFLRVTGAAGVFAAGDVAAALVDGTHSSVMSCQHARPMGRIAGHNVVCDLVGAEMIEIDIGWYVTCLDLGEWGAVYTEGWDRRVAATGPAAKQTKLTINRQRIYPPRSRDPAEILAAAAPVVQAPPRQAAAK